MKQLKFRAWLKNEQRMIDVYYIKIINGKSYIISYGNKPYTEDEFELMESTGFKDKNGKEIFEGDLIKFTDYDDSYWETIVIWSKESASFGVSFGGGYPISFEDLEEFYTELKDVEVAGNIYTQNYKKS